MQPDRVLQPLGAQLVLRHKVSPHQEADYRPDGLRQPPTEDADHGNRRPH